MIPFSKPYTPDGTIQAIEQVLESGKLSGNGPISSLVQERIRGQVGGGQTFLTASCTQALEMSTILLDLSPGDEVILPSFTFTSAVTALVNFGVVPVFVDVEPFHFNINVDRIQSAITARTKAISVVNYAGFGCEYSELLRLKSEYGLYLIEDNAHGLGGKLGNRELGSFGDVSTLSFHATKNLQCGEGGAITINNPELLDRVEILREKGTNRTKFMLGEVQKYQWVDLGGSFLQAEILSAILNSQFDNIDQIQAKRHYIWNTYQEELGGICDDSGVKYSKASSIDSHTAHIYYLLFQNERSAGDFLQESVNRGIQATRHYQPLHSSIGGIKFGRNSGTFENSAKLGTCLIRLPIWHEMTDGQIGEVIESSKRALSN